MKFDKKPSSVVFNAWTVLEGPRSLSRFPGGKKRITCKCRCVCGVEREVGWKDLKAGVSKSCGCSFKYCGGPKNPAGKTHGMSRTKIYVTWRNIIDRCTKPRIEQYPRYGGRGIKVCDRWMKFENFYEDMGDKPGADYSIERLNTDGNYTPENCVWATAKEQANNRTNNYVVVYKGKKTTLAQLSEATNILPSTIWRRIVQHKMSVEAAVTTPVKEMVPHQREFTFVGETKNLYAWAQQCGIPYQSLWHRLFIRGWSIEDALTKPLQKQCRPEVAPSFEHGGVTYNIRSLSAAFGIPYSTAKRVVKKLSIEDVIAKYATKRP